MAEFVFQRCEKKYLLSKTTYERLRERLKPYMAEDTYGLHTICNIYYDTPDDYIIRHSIEKPKYKEKLRLRSYGIPEMDTHVYLEIKKKFRGIVSKRRVSLPLYQAYAYINQGKRPPKQNQILAEIDYFLQRYPVQQGLYLAYDRIALFGLEDNGFRVTFDQNIRSRRIDMGLEHGDHGDLLLPDGWFLMETKIMGATPLWFSHILSELEIQPVSFSKYGNIYRKEHGGIVPLPQNTNYEQEYMKIC